MKKGVGLLTVMALSSLCLTGCFTAEPKEEINDTVSVGIIMENQEAEGTGIVKELRAESAVVEMQGGKRVVLEYALDAHIQSNINVGDKVLFVYRYRGGDYSGTDKDIMLIDNVIYMRVVEKYVEETEQIETIESEEMTDETTPTETEAPAIVDLDTYGETAGVCELPTVMEGSVVGSVLQFGTVVNINENAALVELNGGKRVVAQFDEWTALSDNLGIGSYVMFFYNGLISNDDPAYIPDIDSMTEVFPVDADVEHKTNISVRTLGTVTYIGPKEIRFKNDSGKKFIAKLDEDTLAYGLYDLEFEEGDRVEVYHSYQSDDGENTEPFVVDAYGFTKK